MSDQVYIRYAYDPTGSNPDNLVVNEEIRLSTRELRAAVPMHGPFYVESLRVYDKYTMQPLKRITKDSPTGDFSVPMISQEATLKLGQEVADTFLIMATQPTDTILVTYQAVGGNFQRNIQNVVNIFEAFLNDNRKVDWVTGIYGKPTHYPPGPHPTHMVDIFGFESMNFMLERIYQAILLGNTPAYEMILDALNKNKASKEDVDEGRINDKLVPLDVLQYATNKYNYNQISLTPMEGFAGNGRSVRLEVTATNAPLVDRLYWTIEHITTKHDDFVTNSGSFALNKGEGYFYIQTALTLAAENDEKFRILLRRGGPDRYVVLASYEFTIPKHTSNYKDRILEAMRVSCTGSPRLARKPKIVGIGRGIWKAVHS